MSELTPNLLPVSIVTEHLRLHGELAVLPQAAGMVVLAHAAQSLDERDRLLARHLHAAGLSTFSVDLIGHQEEHYPDIHNNVPLLARRLLDFLALLKNRMMMGELPEQPLGLCAANDTSPALIRVASLRDHDIAAIVCRGGLIDLAGVLYLRSLQCPLLLLLEESDGERIASNRRALREVHCRKELKIIPDVGNDYAVSVGFETMAREAATWFHACFAGTAGRIG